MNCVLVDRVRTCLSPSQRKTSASKARHGRWFRMPCRTVFLCCMVWFDPCPDSHCCDAIESNPLGKFVQVFLTGQPWAWPGHDTGATAGESFIMRAGITGTGPE